MKKFYLLRHDDVNGNSGTGVVAEGCIFGDGTGSYTWLTHTKTVTAFLNTKQIMDLHSHGGRTEMIIEGVKKNSKLFAECTIMAHDRWKQIALEKRTKVAKREKKAA
jgi:hypothetical protein